MNKNTTEVFLALVRAGLWEDIERLKVNNSSIGSFSSVNWQEIMRLAEEQSVVGLVTAGLEHVKEVKVPQIEFLQFIGQSMQIEQQNKAMNEFIGVLVEKMREADISTLLVKGQGIAQCYEKPQWRTSGDVDFYLSNENFEKAKKYFRPLVESFDPDTEYARHINMKYGEWVVEIHATQHCGLSSRIDALLDEIHHDLFYNGNIRNSVIGNTQVFLPSVDNDIIIIFTHFLKHFYKGGLGLRQICDWCRLLWTYRESLNHGLLESRIRKVGLMSEWKAFGCFAVEYLGMPAEAMPFCEISNNWEKKANKIADFILEVGNFGHNRDMSYYANNNLVVRKAISYSRRCKDLIHHASIFPLDSFRFIIGITSQGFRSFIHGE